MKKEIDFDKLPKLNVSRKVLDEALESIHEDNIVEPVAPAPTASAREWLSNTLHWTDDAYRIPVEHGDHYPSLYEVLEMYASSQSEKLAGVGQEAAERIREESCRIGPTLASPEEYAWLGTERIAEIIDRVIAGRVKP